MKVAFETCGLGFLGRAYSGRVFLGGNSFRVLLKGIVSLCGDPRDGQGFSGGAFQVKTLGKKMLARISEAQPYLSCVQDPSRKGWAVSAKLAIPPRCDCVRTEYDLARLEKK